MHTLSKYPIIISLLATVPEEIYSSFTIIFQCLPFGHKLIQFDLVGILLQYAKLYSSLFLQLTEIDGPICIQVLSVVARRPELQKISFVCHSLGGLIARYAIGRLYTQCDQRDSPEENGDCKTCNCGTQCQEHKSKGKIAGLEPFNFITFATPHLGSGFHKQVSGKPLIIYLCIASCTCHL